MAARRKERGGGGGGGGGSGAELDGAAYAAATLEVWVETQRRLLALEQAAEIAETCALLAGPAAAAGGKRPAGKAASGSGGASAGEAGGLTLRHVTVLEVSSGLFGRTQVVLGMGGGGALPAHRFTTGDIVGLLQRGGDKAARAPAAMAALAAAATAPAGGLDGGRGVRAIFDACGVVVRVTEAALAIALDDAGGGEDGVAFNVGDRIRADRLADDVTNRRMLDALGALQDGKTAGASRLVSLLFGPIPGPDAPPSAFPGFDVAAACLGPAGASASASASTSAPTPAPAPDMNASQAAAIDAALRARDLCMIHGPPGTGKTTTVVEYIRREVARGRRVLACAPSNVAVDNMAERLAATACRVVRLGHPARISAAVVPLSLEAQVHAAEGTAIAQDARAELVTLEGQIARTRDRAARRALRGEERALRAEIRRRETTVVMDILRGADVVLTTNTGAATKVLRRACTMSDAGAATTAGGGGGAAATFRPFDVVVIDEVAQAVEVACFIPILLGAKVVIAGDHLQLPPTIMSQEAAAQGLGFTLADRLVARFDAVTPRPPAALMPAVYLLDVQYRMHATIMRWSSEALYGGRLAAAPAVAAHTLAQLPHVTLPPDGEVIVPGAEVAALYAAALAGGGGGGGGSDDGTPSAATPSGAAAAAGGAGDAVSAALAATQPSGAGPEWDVVLPAAALAAPMLLVDTAGCDCAEVVEEGSGSKANAGEARLVVAHVLALLHAGLRPAEVAVVTPYNAQVGLLRRLLASRFPGLEVRSVDGFQGQEKEAIVLSCVRSNHMRDVGFLRDRRRMNVAVTRARRHVALVRTIAGAWHTIVCACRTLSYTTPPAPPPADL